MSLVISIINAILNKSSLTSHWQRHSGFSNHGEEDAILKDDATDMYYYSISIFESNLMTHNIATLERQKSRSSEIKYLPKDNEDSMRRALF